MADWEFSQLSIKSAPAPATDYLPLLDTTDNSTAPAGPGGSDKRSTVQAVTQAAMGLSALGDVTYGGASGVPAKLAGNTTSTRKFFRQTGTGSVSAAPAWDTLVAGDLPAATTSAQGAVVIDGTGGDIQPSPGTAAAGSVGKVADAGHVHGQPPFLAPTGLTGATAAGRYAGATASGAPASGTFATGDEVIDQTGTIWVCTAAGSPGTWTAMVNLAGTQTVTGVKTFQYPGNTAYAATGNLVASTDGTVTSGGAIVLNPNSETRGFISIYSTTLATAAFFVPDVATTHWAPCIGGATGTGIGIAGSTSATGAVVFGCLNFSQTGGYGSGNAAFTVYDNNKVQTFFNTADDGVTGAASFAGVVATKAGTDTSSTATASSPAFTTATAKQLSTVQDVMLYVSVVTAGTYTVQLGPTSTPANTLISSKALAVGQVVALRIPKGWWAEITGTIANLTILQVTC